MISIPHVADKKYLAQFKWFADDNHPDNTTYYAFWMYPKVAKLPAATAETAPIVAFGPSGMHVVASDIRTFCCLLGAQFNGDVLANIIKHKTVRVVCCERRGTTRTTCSWLAHC